MSWTYRIGKTTQNGETFFGICEIYIDTTGRVKAWSDNTIYPGGADVEELSRDLAMMVKATAAPPVDLDALANADKKNLPLYTDLT